MVDGVISPYIHNKVLSDSMLLELDIAIREIEKRLDSIEIEYKAYGADPGKGIKVIQDINATVAVSGKAVINNIMINNIEMKSMSFVLEIKDILDLLKQKVRHCKLLSEKE